MGAGVSWSQVFTVAAGVVLAVVVITLAGKVLG